MERVYEHWCPYAFPKSDNCKDMKCICLGENLEEKRKERKEEA
jgi:hypothetical protein